MGKHFLVADVHLEPEADPITWQTFFAFLDFVREQKGSLYILGDLFDYWTNNKVLKKKYQPLFEKLSAIAAANFVGILTGNRDFLLNKDYLSNRGINYWGDGARLTLEGQRLFLTHGDDLWNKDRGYTLYKRLAWPLFRCLDAVVPGVIANTVALNLRTKSRRSNGNKFYSQPPIDEQLLQKYFQSGIDLVVCGHIHTPNNREYPDGKRLIILPAWKERMGGYCLISEGRAELMEFKK
ncbi:MAG: metallophosphoesterase [Candidatus Schekmanbacteria bacterium]|nr:metallophosphoesterase [Candidatus Schekmanbacteria bacterium]